MRLARVGTTILSHASREDLRFTRYLLPIALPEYVSLGGRFDEGAREIRDYFEHGKVGRQELRDSFTSLGRSVGNTERYYTPRIQTRELECTSRGTQAGCSQRTYWNLGFELTVARYGPGYDCRLGRRCTSRR